jgi:6-phosphogluconolactonase (cycloisomerase 2 family)
MPFGQSAFSAFVVGNVTKRLTYLSARHCFGKSPREADLLSDDLSLSAASSVGTMVSVLTLDPVGGALTMGYCNLLASEMESKEKAMAEPKKQVY